MSKDVPSSRWEAIAGRADGAAYAAQFAALHERGVDVHGEARLCASLVPTGARVLDAGCGTGRVAVKLHEWGYVCVGVDSDPSMLAEATRHDAEIEWLCADLARLDITQSPLDTPFALVVAAGNVIPLLAEGTESAVIATLASLLEPSGLLVAGFGLHPDHLPLHWVPVELSDYDTWCATHGLELVQRFSTWDGQPFTDGGYAVSVHRKR